MRPPRRLRAPVLLAATTGLVVLSLGVPGSADATGSRTPSDAASCAPAPVGSLSVRQLANQAITVPVQAQEVGAIAPAVRAGFGGILLFGATAPANLGQVLAQLRRLVPSRLAPLVMTDEEGGGVVRLENLVGPLPWARTMAKTMAPAAIRALSKRVGARLLAAGVNVDLAPVLDVDGRNVAPGATDPDGYRSFGGSPSVVITDGPSFMSGLQAAGVLPVVKHFPGLGGATGNTDDGPAATLPWATLKASDLHTFEAAINRGAPAIMVANAHIPGLTALPASISPEVLRAILRTWLGFKGLILTDSLTAGAISGAHLSVPKAAVLSLNGGADMVLLGAQANATADMALAQQVSNAIVRAVQHGTLRRTTLQSDVSYILATKASLHC